MSDNQVLVTGAEGFIGSHLVEELVRRGHNVRALVQYNSFSDIGWLGSLPQSVLDSVEVVLGDVRDAERVSEAVRGSTKVFHLAALIAIPYSFSAPRSYLETNVMGTLNVLNSCRFFEVEKLIHTSTSEVYGTAQTVPMPESHPKKPQSPYAASKAAADHLVESFVASYNLPATILRPFNTFGPRQSSRAIIPTVITQILAGTDVIKLGTVSATRDFTYISDTVEGFVLAGNSEHADGLSINLGTGIEWPISHVVDEIRRIMGSNAEVVTSPERIRPGRSEVERLLSDNSVAKRVLGWQPKLTGSTGLAEGLIRTIDWLADSSGRHTRVKTDGYIV